MRAHRSRLALTAAAHRHRAPPASVQHLWNEQTKPVRGHDTTPCTIIQSHAPRSIDEPRTAAVDCALSSAIIGCELGRSGEKSNQPQRRPGLTILLMSAERESAHPVVTTATPVHPHAPLIEGRRSRTADGLIARSIHGAAPN